MFDSPIKQSDETPKLKNKKPLIEEKFNHESSESSDGRQGASEESPNLNPEKPLLKE